jgi:hypothetical protein
MAGLHPRACEQGTLHILQLYPSYTNELNAGGFKRLADCLKVHSNQFGLAILEAGDGAQGHARPAGQFLARHGEHSACGATLCWRHAYTLYARPHVAILIACYMRD